MSNNAVTPETLKVMTDDVACAVREAIAEFLRRQADAIQFSEQHLVHIGIGMADMDFLLEEIAERLDLGTEAFHEELKVDYEAQPIDTIGELRERVLAAILKGAA